MNGKGLETIKCKLQRNISPINNSGRRDPVTEFTTLNVLGIKFRTVCGMLKRNNFEGKICSEVDKFRSSIVRGDICMLSDTIGARPLGAVWGYLFS